MVTPSGRRLPFAYRLAVWIVRPLLMALTKRDWRGGEHLPATGGFVVAPNHVSHLDPFAFAHFMYDSGHSPYFLGKESVFRVPVVGAIVRGARQIPVYREHRARGRGLPGRRRGGRGGQVRRRLPRGDTDP